jgi:hypothetical protein
MLVGWILGRHRLRYLATAFEIQLEGDARHLHIYSLQILGADKFQCARAERQLQADFPNKVR